MKVIEHIEKTTKPTFSYELLPPLKGSSIAQIFAIVEQLKLYNPSWINVTSHASSLLNIEDGHGNTIRKIVKKRPGTISVCGVIQNKFAIDTVAHILCQGFAREETENALIELSYLNVTNVLALRGDNLNYDKNISTTYSVNNYANELTTQIANMRYGKFLDNTDYLPLDFCVGVAAYPEKHFTSATIEEDIRYLKQKVDAGAQYIITQMFFDNNKYYDFVIKCRNSGITIPIIPGIKVLKNIKQIQSIPRLFNIKLPNELVSELEKNPEFAKEIGQNWARWQIIDLIKHGINNIHFFLMNDVSTVLDIVESI